MEITPELEAALNRMEAFVAQATGRAPDPEELAHAMTRYFVLKEIREFIEMARQEASG
ncbi:MAG: hypothetical protein HUN04_22115 [Desulfobacter sp.]|nr:MAG: hypothetical protein HUN04_22115 [Desulfobacter sp.]